MKSIARKDFISAGTVNKTHGTKGDLMVSVTTGKPIREWAFLEIQGKPVPFYVESFQPTFDDFALLKLKGVHSLEQAQQLIGYTLLQLKGKRSKSALHPEDEELLGYLLVDEARGTIGKVEALEEFPNQLLFRTTFNGAELLIPAVDAFIKDINDTQQTITLVLPEGLLPQ